MTIKTAARPRPRRVAKKPSQWPRLRLVVTVLFFLLITSNIWASTSCSFSVGSVEFACPLGVVQVMAAARTFIPALALAGFLGFVLIAIFGRAFCSWICPGRWIFNRGPAVDSKPWKYRAWAQRIIVGGVVGASFACKSAVFCVICPAGVACRGAIAAGTGGSILPTVGWFGTMLGIEWTTGRSWCRDLCPLGAAFSQISRLNPFFKLKADPNKCIPCTACTKACPEGLNISQSTDLSSCTKCFACEAACPRNAVQMKVFPPSTISLNSIDIQDK